MHNLGQRLGLYLAPILAAVSIGIAAPVALGEDKAAPPADASSAAANPADANPAAASPTDPIPADQLEQLVAPIALYPDALIAQILMASTYPLDVVQANRWLGEHVGLEGEALQKTVDPEEWDDSVKALVFFPSVLGFMSDNLDWTQDLGDAVLSQQGELTDTIQRLRGEADKAGALQTNEQQRVEKAGDTIIIQPAQPEVVYVPTYDPVKVYGQETPPRPSTTQTPMRMPAPATTPATRQAKPPANRRPALSPAVPWSPPRPSTRAPPRWSPPTTAPTSG
jgi:hypothetical protein